MGLSSFLTRHGVKARGFQNAGVGECGSHAAAEFFFASGDAGEAAIARRPIAGRQIEEDVFETCGSETFGDGCGWMVVGEHELDGAKASGCGGGKTV